MHAAQPSPTRRGSKRCTSVRRSAQRSSAAQRAALGTARGRGAISGANVRRLEAGSRAARGRRGAPVAVGNGTKGTRNKGTNIRTAGTDTSEKDTDNRTKGTDNNRNKGTHIRTKDTDTRNTGYTAPCRSGWRRSVLSRRGCSSARPACCCDGSRRYSSRQIQRMHARAPRRMPNAHSRTPRRKARAGDADESSSARRSAVLGCAPGARRPRERLGVRTGGALRAGR
jgi:hypothetical protein